MTYNLPGDDIVAYDLVEHGEGGLRGKQSEIVQQTVFNVEVAASSTSPRASWDRSTSTWRRRTSAPRKTST